MFSFDRISLVVEPQASSQQQSRADLTAAALLAPNQKDIVKKTNCKPLAIAASVLLAPAASQAQALPSGPPVKTQIVTQPGPTYLQFTRIDIPLLREAIALLKLFPALAIWLPALIR